MMRSLIHVLAAGLAALAGVILTPMAGATTIEPRELPGMCVSLSGADGASISTPCDKSAAQDFGMPGTEGGPIRLGDKCLAPRGDDNYPALFADVCDGSPGQRWTVSGEGEIRNEAGRCLALLGQSSRTGAPVYGGRCEDAGALHRWKLKAADQEIYEPVVGRVRWLSTPELCLTYIEAGSYMGLAACDEGLELNQVFSFDAHDPSQFRMLSGCLTSYAMTGITTISRCADLKAATWKLQPSAFLSNGDGQCATGKLEGAGHVVRIEACTGAPEQIWTFAPLE